MRLHSTKNFLTIELRIAGLLVDTCKNVELARLAFGQIDLQLTTCRDFAVVVVVAAIVAVVAVVVVIDLEQDKALLGLGFGF